MVLKTKRLDIIPLKAEELEMALENYENMGSHLGVRVSCNSLSDELKYAMNVRLKKVLEDNDNYMWLTTWVIILKEENMIVGFLMIKGYPNEDGEVIVGYGIEDEYQKRGYATEALNELKEWIFMNPEVNSIMGDTDKDNLASHNVLKKVGAFKSRENEDLIWWEIKR